MKKAGRGRRRLRRRGRGRGGGYPELEREKEEEEEEVLFCGIIAPARCKRGSQDIGGGGGGGGGATSVDAASPFNSRPLNPNQTD